MANNPWYFISNLRNIDSPALLVYPDRILDNIHGMINIAGTPLRLVPHVKTHKMSQVVKMQLKEGISSFKCATIAEVEMLANAGAKRILLAYQLTETKAIRFLNIIKHYNGIDFASLIDNMSSARMLNSLFNKKNLVANVYVDINNGMNRTGFPANGDIVSFYKKVASLSNIHLIGLHVYDGHIVEKEYEKRKIHCDSAFIPIRKVIKKIELLKLPIPEIIAGGSPTFLFHALRADVLCSPGTTILWDKEYKDLLPDLPFSYAALLLSRVISKPAPGIITTDLGYKSIASENLLNKRVFFLNLKSYTVISQDEEHLIIKVRKSDWNNLNIGYTLFGVPYHICPTVALYDEAQIVVNGKVIDQWQVEARRRSINF